MSDLTIYIGNKNYSSWSLRPWLALKQTGLAFKEIVVPIGQPTTRSTILLHSPSGKVPALRHGDLVLWESLAICEYLAELAPDRGLWPESPVARATARSISHEMHAGFAALRANLPMNIRSSFPNRAFPPEVWTDVGRILALWGNARREYGADGPFLFGQFCIADAMFAPVVARFRTYGVTLDADAQAYGDAVWAFPAFQEWRTAAHREPMIIDSYEF
jgi:glutathione S-transferase